MSICEHCGVELIDGSAPCPLCQERPKIDTKSVRNRNPYLKDDSPLTIKQKVRLFWELSTILHFSALVVTILIDLVTNKKPTWSLYAMTSITASFVYITLLCYTLKRLWIFLPGLLINSLGFLVLIDLFDNGINWFVNPGLPLTGFFVLLLGFVLFFSYRTREKGFNIIAAISIAIGIYCLIVEVFIELAVSDPVSVSWSAIVATSILPFSLLLFFFHYRLKRGTNLKKFFHL